MEDENGFLSADKRQMFSLKLWSKKLKTNQNAGFFKLQYLTKNLRCIAEFLDMTRIQRKH